MAAGMRRLFGAALVAVALAACGDDSTGVSADGAPEQLAASRFAIYLVSGSPDDVIDDFVFGGLADPERKIETLVYDEADRAVEVVTVPGATRSEVLDKLRELFRDLTVECVAEVPGEQTGDVPPRDHLPSGACEPLV